MENWFKCFRATKFFFALEGTRCLVNFCPLTIHQ